LPSAQAFRKTFAKFQREGTCHNLHKGNSGRLRAVRTQENYARFRASLEENGKRSSRRNGLQISPTSFRRIAKEIKFHPYVLVSRQKLKDTDLPRRLEFCNWFLRKINDQADFLSRLVVSDEANFSLNSEVNTKNVVKYAEFGQGHPEDHYVEFEQGAGQVMVWMGLTGEGQVLGPHFVQGRLNTAEYLRIIRYHVIQNDFRRQNIQRDLMWWQQDGAPAHASKRALRCLRGQFPGRVISLRGDHPWPPLTVCDFFLWGYLKHQIWNQDMLLQPKSLRELKLAITNATNALDQNMIRRAFNGMLHRVNKCINVNGSTFSNE